jgi:N utilization substance protein A
MSAKTSETNHAEIEAVLDHMEKEKGISRENMAASIKNSIEHAAARSITAGQQLEVTVDPKKGYLSAAIVLTVVDSVSDPAKEIHISEAQKVLRPEQLPVKVGDIIRRDYKLADLGRIVAQATKQAILQSVRQFEKEHIFDEFKGQVGEIVNGVVRRKERGDIIVELGKAEATLPARERSLRDDFNVNDRIRCLLLKIENRPGGPEIILSRNDPNFIKKLLELEVSEIGDGTVFVAAYARNPGFRTKIAVDTRDPKVDPVGSTVGARGVRIRNVVRELNDEKIDVLRWYSDPVQMLVEAIKPAKPLNLVRDEEQRRLTFAVAEGDLKVVIGHKGNNANLTGRLIGWKLNILKDERRADSFTDKLDKAVDSWANVAGISRELAERIVTAGFTKVIEFEDEGGATAEDLIEAGFEPAEAARIVDLVLEAKKIRESKGAKKPKAKAESAGGESAAAGESAGGAESAAPAANEDAPAPAANEETPPPAAA